MPAESRCPCRKVTETIPYTACCGPFHAGTSIPTTAEALMRSRFCAYARADHAYVLATWHASTRPAALEGHDAWTMLKVYAAQETGDTGTVSFTARWRRAGRSGALSETSRFVREDGRWFYVDGVQD
jgi:SEC-C motif domain protein